MTYAFRLAAASDLSMLRRWLGAPEAVRWWGDPEAEYALLAEDLENPLMAMRVVSLDGRPFAYVQDYDVGVWPQAHLAGLPAGTRAIDAFIGEPDLIGRGHGAAFLRLRARQLMDDGAPCVAVDPDAANLRARRAYARAGFSGDAIVETAQGPVVVMVFEGQTDAPSQSAPR